MDACQLSGKTSPSYSPPVNLTINRNTPIGFLNRLILVKFPWALRQLDLTLTNGRITDGGARLGHHLMNDKHPLIVIFFLGLVTACATLFVPVVWNLLHLYHKLLVVLLLPQPYLFLYLSAKRNKQTYIETANHAEQMRHYPYDRILYYPGLTCRTCKFLKPARSKHCSICKTCVARMDHHCVWVNNCLGRGNHKWFLALLLSTGILIAYAAYLAHLTLSPQVHAKFAKHARWYTYVPQPGSDPSTWSTYSRAKIHHFLAYTTLYLDIGGLRAAGVGLLALLTWPLPLGLLAYHIYLLWAGMTTNESAKWADWSEAMAAGVVFLGYRRQDTMYHHGRNSTTDTPSESEEPPTSWPLESNHILVRTRDGQPPTVLPPRIKAVARQADGDDDKNNAFERIWDLAAVENVYDLGFWDNVCEVLVH